MFKEPDRRGKVLGNDVTASPVTVGEMLGVQRAGQIGDEAALAAMRKLIGDHVRDDVGDAIDPDTLSPRAIKALFKFLTQDEGDASDFT